MTFEKLKWGFQLCTNKAALAGGERKRKRKRKAETEADTEAETAETEAPESRSTVAAFKGKLTNVETETHLGWYAALCRQTDAEALRCSTASYFYIFYNFIKLYMGREGVCGMFFVENGTVWFEIILHKVKIMTLW